MLEVCQTQDGVHRAQQWSMMRKLLGEALWVLAHGRQRWTVGVPTDEGGFKEGQEGHHLR